MSSAVDKTAQSHQRKAFRRAAYVVSLVFHIGLIAALAVWYVNRRPEQHEEPTSLAPANESHESQPPRRPNPPPPSPDVTSNQVNNTLDRMQQEYEEKPAAEQLGVLEQKAAELEDLASEESIDEIAEKFQQWTNIQPRASAPAEEPIAGEFDFDTGQLHEVRKVDTKDGRMQYLGVLVDARGRSLEVEMNTEEGETAYQTLETLKRFPLANRVYRQIGMALLDQAAATSDKTAADGIAPGGAAQEDDRDPFDGQLDAPPAQPAESAATADESDAATP